MAAQSYTYQQPSALTSLMNTAGGIGQLYETIFGGGSSAPTFNFGSDEDYADFDLVGQEDSNFVVDTGTLGGANT